MRAHNSCSHTPLPPLFFLFALIFLVLASGCSPQTGPSGPGGRPDRDSVVKPLQDNNSGKSLENLQTFRGLFSAREGGGVLTLCDTGTELKVQDRTEGGLESVTREFAPSQGDAFFVELRGRRVVRPPYDRTQGALSGPPEELLADAVAFEVLHASHVMESLGCRERFDAFSFKARGNEPGWMVLAEPGRLSFGTMEMAQPLVFRGVLRTGDDENTAYEATGVTLTVTRGWCRDTMSGELFGWMAEVEVNGKMYRGCAVRGDLF